MGKYGFGAAIVSPVIGMRAGIFTARAALVHVQLRFVGRTGT